MNVKVSDIKKIVEIMNADNYWYCERVGGIRVSPHFYNSFEDAEKFVDKLDKTVKSL